MDAWHMSPEERIKTLRETSGTSLQLGSLLIPDFTAPRACDVDRAFMHRRLGQIIRFSGHPRAISVAEHQHLVAELAKIHGEPEGVVRWARYHDAHEFALGDTVAPIKRLLSDVLHRLELAWDAAIADAVGIPLPTDQERARVKVYDLLSRRIEWVWIMGLRATDLGCWAEGLPSAGETERDAIAIVTAALGIQRASVIFGLAPKPPRRPHAGHPALMAQREHGRLWRIVEGAVVDAMRTHPEYFTAAARSTAVCSITKRVVGQLVGHAHEARERGPVGYRPLEAGAAISAPAIRAAAATEVRK